MMSLSRIWSRKKDIGRVVLLVSIGLLTFNQTVLQRVRQNRGIAESKAAGLAEQTGWEPIALSRQLPFRAFINRARNVDYAVVGGVPGGIAGGGGGRIRVAALTELSSDNDVDPSAAEPADRKIARNTSLDLVVQKPREVADKIHALATRFGGYLVSSQVSGAGATFASTQIRVPADRAEEAVAEIRKLAVRVENERTEAEDVTKQYVDLAARLRNHRAAEQQFLQILKRATTVKDTLEVTDKLNDVRGQIEQAQAEFTTLYRRVETVTINVELRAEADVQVLGLQWRPLFRAKLAVRDAAEAFADYAATMFGFILQLPVIALWLVTVVGFAALGWKILRWAARRFFGWPKPKAVVA
jgi:hypothetical protein